MLSGKAKNLLNRSSIMAQFPYLIKIENEDLGTFYFANSDDDVQWDGNIYQASFFNVTPPQQTETSIGNATISISAVDREWIRRIRTTQKRSILTFTSVMVYEDDARYVEPIEEMTFLLTKATWTDEVIEWTMEFDDKFNTLMPCDVADTWNCSGCVK